MLSSAVHTLAAGPSIDTTSMLPASNADVICIMVGFWTATPRFSWLGIREYSTPLPRRHFRRQPRTPQRRRRPRPLARTLLCSPPPPRTLRCPLQLHPPNRRYQACLDVPSLIPGIFPDVRLGTNRQFSPALTGLLQESWSSPDDHGCRDRRGGGRCRHKCPHVGLSSYAQFLSGILGRLLARTGAQIVWLTLSSTRRGRPARTLVRLSPFTCLFGPPRAARSARRRRRRRPNPP